MATSLMLTEDGFEAVEDRSDASDNDYAFCSDNDYESCDEHEETAKTDSGAQPKRAQGKPSQKLQGKDAEMAKKTHSRGGKFLVKVNICNQTPLSINRKGAYPGYFNLVHGKINAPAPSRRGDVPVQVGPWEKQMFTVSGRQDAPVGPQGSAFFDIGDSTLTLMWDNGLFSSLKGRAEMHGQNAQRFVVICDVDTVSSSLTFRIFCRDTEISATKVSDLKAQQPAWEKYLMERASSWVDFFQDRLVPTQGQADFEVLGQQVKASLAVGLESDKFCSWNGVHASWCRKKGAEK